MPGIAVYRLTLQRQVAQWRKDRYPDRLELRRGIGDYPCER
jgi:hypothetical protein